jgi:hypothetical protein
VIFWPETNHANLSGKKIQVTTIRGAEKNRNEFLQDHRWKTAKVEKSFPREPRMRLYR